MALSFIAVSSSSREKKTSHGRRGRSRRRCCSFPFQIIRTYLPIPPRLHFFLSPPCFRWRLHQGVVLSPSVLSSIVLPGWKAKTCSFFFSSSFQGRHYQQTHHHHYFSTCLNYQLLLVSLTLDGELFIRLIEPSFHSIHSSIDRRDERQ